MFWPAGLFSSKKTIRASSLTIGQYIKGKNGYIYKVVDLVHVSSETLITTFHELKGQESFSVKPNEPIEYIETDEAEDISSVETVTPAGSGDEAPETAIAYGRRATTSEVARARRESPVLTSGENLRRVMSEYAMIAPNFTRREGSLPVREAEEAESKLLSANSLKNATDELMLGKIWKVVDEGLEKAVDVGQTRSSGSFENYHDLLGFLEHVTGVPEDENEGMMENSGSRETKEESAVDAQEAGEISEFWDMKLGSRNAKLDSFSLEELGM
jgi:hypothetical protein